MLQPSDLSDERRASPIAAANVDALATLERSASVGTWEYEIASQHLSWSPGSYRVHGQDLANYVPDLQAWLQLFEARSRQRLSYALERALVVGRGWDQELELCVPPRGCFWVRVVAEPQWQAGRVVRLSGCVIDVHANHVIEQESRRLRHRLQASSRRDALSGLPNRLQLEVELEARLALARQGNCGGWLMYLDLDRFKLVNDQCGHRAGDRLIQEIAALLSKQISPDRLLAHLGGDEFGLVIDAEHAGDALALADWLISVVDRYRFQTRERSFHVGLSVGVAAIGGQAADAGELLGSADAACQMAKRNGSNRAVLYQAGDARMTRARDEMEWAEEVLRALDEDRIELYAQRIVSVSGGRPPAYEILMRMRAADGKLIPPDQFLPAARHYGLMAALDRRIVQLVLEQFTGGLLDGIDYDHVAVNLSAASLSDESFVAFLKQALYDSRIDPDRLRFEITESEAFSNLREARETVRSLRAMGFRMLLDDFGIGFTSFNYLRQMRIDGLKIDKGFTRALDSDRFNQAIVASICKVCSELGIEVVAEGVEEAHTLQTLSELGVRFAQGWLFHRPEPLSEALREPAVSERVCTLPVARTA